METKPQAPKPEDNPEPERRSRLSTCLHIGFWTALFYGLTVLVAKLAEWGSGR